VIRKFCACLLVSIIVLQPVLAQSPDTGKVITIDLGLASDEEFAEALKEAKDLEFINKDNPTNDTAGGSAGGSALSNETPNGSAGGGGQKVSVPAVSVPADEIHDNEYLQESRRLANLAEEEFSKGDYDASAKYADEAALLAKQSDVYAAIATAKTYIDNAVSSGVSVRYAPEYREAENWYQQSVNARDSEEWDIAIDAANMVAELLDGLDASGSASGGKAASGTTASGSTVSVPLPATYTVRPWAVSKDCFWNIAGFPWVYGNPRQWRLLYNANKSKLDNPNNPNVLEPGTVLDIPSIKGELREGAWDSSKSYEPLK